MTNKEKIEGLYELKQHLMNNPIELCGYKSLPITLIDYSIEALEQEPCEDAISRQKVLDLIEHYNSDGLGSVFYGYEEGVKFANAVNKLPSVNPQLKTGHWVDGEYCSECGCDVPAYIIDWKWQKDMDAKWCPMCGAKMESEDKE